MSAATVVILGIVAVWLGVLAVTAALCRAAARDADTERDREDREVAELERLWELHLPARVLIDRHTR